MSLISQNKEGGQDRPRGASGPASSVKSRWLVASLVGFTFLMLGLSFAAVPLYQMFCAVTGYGGTPQRALAPSAVTSSEQITVRFDANVSPKLRWYFEPLQRNITLRMGENRLAFYRATNTSSETITGTATFNVLPETMGQYFNKVQCFCFQEQTLKPGESIEMPVSFFVDPAMLKDRDVKNLRDVTLSYTFFRLNKSGETALYDSEIDAKPSDARPANAKSASLGKDG